MIDLEFPASLHQISRARVAEWFTVMCCVWHGWSWVQAPNRQPMLVDMDQKHSAAMLTPIQSAGVTPEVNLRITQARKHARDPPWL